MNGMTHKQARKWIDRRQDGLLKGNQQTLLEEHLHSCDTCRTYSDEMELLASRLNDEFQTRWEDDPGPSKLIVENVRTKAKSIPAAKRFSSGFQMAGGVAVLLVLGIVINFFVSQLRDSAPVASGTEVVSSFPAAEDRLIAFSSTQNGNSDIYTMHADGSGLTNLTNNPAYDGFAHWSPDGKQIAFESDRDGSSQIYLMNADGSNVIQLTHGDENNFLAGSIESPWSPDGSRLLVNRQTDSQNHQIYVIDVAGTNAILLTKDAGQYYSPMWSPNGEYIAFISDANDPSINRHLYIVDSQGNELIDLTGNLPQNERFSFADYYWSPDGKFITFTTDSQSGTYKSTVYKASLDGTRVQVARTNQQILDWWNGITLQNDPPQKVDETSWSIMQADGSQASLSTCKSNDRFLAYSAVKRSLNGNLFFGFHCTPSGWMLYGANRDGSNIHELISSPLDGKYDSLGQVAWSPDDHFLAFLALDGENIQLEDLYILNANDPSTQPLKMENSSSPSWQPVINENLVKEKSPAKLTIDPQSCKPAEADSVPGELSGYDVIQNTSFTDGDFTYDFWLYCDPALKPEDPEHFSAITGVGVYSAWTYTGPQVDGPYQYHYAFEPDKPFGTSGTDGPLYRASAKGKLGGIDFAETRIQESIQQGVPLQFRVVIDSSLGQDGAILSFNLLPAEQGYKIANVQAEKLNNSNKGLIAFTSVDENGNTDIYTVHPDGSGLDNLTNNSVRESWLAWSPDGTQLAFVSDQDGNENIFVINADGGDLRRLTDDPRADTYPVWSPDGKRIAYTLHDPDEKTANLYIMDSDGENQRRLTDRHTRPDRMWVWAEEWSLDGKYIFYLDQQQVSRVNTESGEITPVTPEMDIPSYLTISQDESKILYFTDCKDGSLEFCSTSKTIGKDGTGEKSNETISLQQVCTSAGALSDKVNDFYYGAKWSPDRTKILFAFNCLQYGEMFYLANADGSGFKPLLDYPILTGYPGPNQGINFDWSPDGQSIILASSPEDPNTQDLYLLNIEKALQNPELHPSQLNLLTSQAGSLAWQPVATETSVKPEPIPQPSETVSAGDLIVFTSFDANGNTDIYMVHPDGSGLVNLTKNAAKESSLVWSPDGRQLAFASNQYGSWDIFSVKADGSDLTRLTEDSGDESPSLWSPNGKRIAYTLFGSDGKTINVYVMDANGENKRPLTDLHPKPVAVGVGVVLWSLDSQSIFYIEQDQLYKVNIESGEITPLPVRLYAFLTQRGDSDLQYFSSCMDSDIFCFSPNTIAEDGTGKETYQNIELEEVCPTKEDPGARRINFYFLAKWSPDRTKIIFHFNCGDGGQRFYIANADGSGFQPLTGVFLSTGYPGLNNDIHFDWSPDSQSIIFTSSPDGPHTQDLFTLNIGNALQNPESQPTPLHLSTSQVSELAWQPAP